MVKAAEFFSNEYHRLVRYVRYLIDDTADREAEDVVQDVMVNLFTRADVSLPIENLSAYIYRSLRNRVTDLFRKRKDKKDLRQLAQVPSSDSALELEKKEILESVFEAIDTLDEDQKAVVLATELDGRSFRELSEEWDVPIGTLLARKSRALKKLRKKLSWLDKENHKGGSNV